MTKKTRLSFSSIMTDGKNEMYTRSRDTSQKTNTPCFKRKNRKKVPLINIPKKDLGKVPSLDLSTQKINIKI